MKKLLLKFILRSDACFSRGDGTAGEVDIEVQHDQYGLPFLNGRALKGLIHEEAADLVEALALCGSSTQNWMAIANNLFGQPGSGINEQGAIKFGDAVLPEDFRRQVIYHINGEHDLDASQVFRLLTSIRTQTANDETGAPKPESLRVMRVIPNSTPFYAELVLEDQVEEIHLAFLAACLKAFRRAGSNKTRGMGKLSADLLDPVTGLSVLEGKFKCFEEGI